MSEINSLSKLIKIKREELGLSQRELAKLMDIPPSSLNRIESGELNASSATIEKFLVAVRLDIELVEHEGKKRGVFEIVNYVLQECLKKLDGDYDVSNMKLNKLLYFIQKEYYLKTGELMFDNQFKAWVHGPVHLEVYHKYSNRGSNPIDDIKPYIGGLSEKEIEIINDVIKYYYKDSAYQLRKLSHEDKPWIEARKKGDNETIDFTLLSK